MGLVDQHFLDVGIPHCRPVAPGANAAACRSSGCLPACCAGLAARCAGAAAAVAAPRGCAGQQPGGSRCTASAAPVERPLLRPARSGNEQQPPFAHRQAEGCACGGFSIRERHSRKHLTASSTSPARSSPSRSSQSSMICGTDVPGLGRCIRFASKGGPAHNTCKCAECGRTRRRCDTAQLRWAGLRASPGRPLPGAWASG